MSVSAGRPVPAPEAAHSSGEPRAATSRGPRRLSRQQAGGSRSGPETHRAVRILGAVGISGAVCSRHLGTASGRAVPRG